MAAYKYVSPEGVIVPDTSAILEDTNTEFQDVMGKDVPVNPSSPQGVLIASDVAVRSEVVANNAVVANQINPNYAGGIFLDDIWALTGGKRRAATYTIVDNVKLTGVPGIVIPSGARRATSAGDVFQLLTTVILSAAGVAYGSFQALEEGAIDCPVHSLTVPVAGYTAIGWETSDNEEAGTIGSNQQSDLSARQERKQTLAQQGRSLSEAVFSRVRAVDGVRSMTFRENKTNVAKTIDGIALNPNSVWVCVDGGLNADIAAALYRSISGGAGYNGAISVNVKDPFSGQTDTVKFDRPTAKPIMVRVTGNITGSMTSNPEAIVKQAVVDYGAGLLENSEQGFAVGEDVSPYEIASAVNYRAPGIFVTKVEIALQPASGEQPAWQTTTMDISLKEKATVDLSSVLVVVA